MNLKSTLNLAGRHMLDCLCADENHLPYWHMAVDANLMAEYQFSRYRNAHNVGRFWNAMLRLEDATGHEIPTDVEAAMLENTWRMCDNPTGTLLDEVDPDDASNWYIHSYRETMLAFGLLVKYRGSDQAREAGLRAISRMQRAGRDPAVWDFCNGGDSPRLRPDPTFRDSDPVYTHGRAIEGIICFAETTGEEEAVAEAARLAEFHFQRAINIDGSLADGCGHHTHSYLNMIRGVLMYAAQAGKADWIEAIYATYRNAITDMITPSGFIPHDINARFNGDPASAGDVAHIALLLWDHVRDASLLDDIERIVRARLVPAQVTSAPELKPRKTEARDCFRDLANRFVGSVGVNHVSGQTCAPDFTAAVLHSLIEIYNRIVDRDDECVRVNFHLDHDGPDVSVQSVRDSERARVTVQNDTGKPLLIRIPGWVPDASIDLSVNGEPVALDSRNGFACIPGRPQRVEIRMGYALPRHCSTEAWRDQSASQPEVTFSWRGDEIYEVDPGGEYLKLSPRESKFFY